jgi:hypothetical protein
LKRVLPLLFAIALTTAVAGCGGGDNGDGGQTTKTSFTGSACDINGKQRNLGASYVTSISVRNVGCAQAEKVVAAYHACRQQNGGAGGTCDTPVMGFQCTEGSRQSVPGVQFNATADCRRGDAEIQSSYTQNF